VGDFLLGDVMGKLIEVMLAHFLDELLREVMDANVARIEHQASVSSSLLCRGGRDLTVLHYLVLVFAFAYHTH
jgi:hypothetical protein